MANDDQNGDATGEYTLPEGLIPIGPASDPPPSYTSIEQGLQGNPAGSKLAAINALVPFADGLFNEGSPTKGVNWSDNTLRYRRSMAYHKMTAFTDQDGFDATSQDAGLFTTYVRAFAQQATVSSDCT
ncbi:MAG TPA: hypothetical protein ENI74_10480 [Gammaproteobacteria bacterium]|nr:hypothetical protein [Gammaproteobacteria bacterium]